MTLRPLVELGVDEAYELLVNQLGAADVPPLEAIENEDWGRDLLLSRLASFPAERLRALGVTLDPSAETPTAESEGSVG